MAVLAEESGLMDQFCNLWSSYQKNGGKLGAILVRIITARPGGMNEKNSRAVMTEIMARVIVARATLQALLAVGVGQIHPDVFALQTDVSVLARSLDMESQQHLLNGWPVVTRVDLPPVVKRLHEMDNLEEAHRVIDIDNHVLRDAEAQRELFRSQLLVKEKAMFSITKDGQQVKFLLSLPVAELKYFIARLIDEKLVVVTKPDPTVRARIDKAIKRYGGV